MLKKMDKITNVTKNKENILYNSLPCTYYLNLISFQNKM